MAKKQLHEEDDYESYVGTPDTVKEWIDDKMHTVGDSAYRGALQVLTAGFGKGVLATAALVGLAAVSTALFFPAALGITGALTAGAAVETGLLIAGNTLLGSGLGVMGMITGGALGSMLSAHGENTRLSKEAAQERAGFYEAMRQRNQNSPSLAKDMGIDNGQSCGHCAKLMNDKDFGQGMSR